MAQLVVLIKNLIKSSLDNYVLPGTLSGTEILWLYLVHWKRDLVALVAAVLYLLLSTWEELRPERAVFNGNITEGQEQ